MPESISSLIAEARGLAQARTSESVSPPRATSISEQIAEARARIRDRVGEFSTVTPKFERESEDDFRVSRVIDGDTVELEGIGPVRLTGLHAPETVHPNKAPEPRGKESSHLASIMLAGKRVKLAVSPEGRDKYGRTLGQLTLPDGRVANAELSTALARYSPTPAGSPLRDRGAARSAVSGMVSASIMRGLIYPISALVPNLHKSLTEEIDSAKQALHQYINNPQVFESLGKPSQTIQDLLVGTPAVLGEIIGAIGPGIGAYSATQAAFKVRNAVTVGEKTLRHMQASVAAGAGFGVGAKLEDGESRFARIARDAVLAGAGEAVFLPLMRRAWRSELGEKIADTVTKDYALSKGISMEEADRKLTAMRTGALPSDFETAKEVLGLTKTNPELRGSPIHVQAAKSMELLETVLPEQPVTIEPNLPKELALAFDLVVDGQPLPIRMASRSAATKDQILDELDMVATSVSRELATGRNVRIHNPIVRDVRTWEFFKNRLLGRGIKKNPIGKPLGHAPTGSVAETAKPPVVGDRVSFIADDGTRQVGEVTDVGDRPTSFQEFMRTDPVVQSAREKFQAEAREIQKAFYKKIGKPDPNDVGVGGDDAAPDLAVLHQLTGTSAPTSTPPGDYSRVAKARLLSAGLNEADLASMSELDVHVAAALARPGSQVKQRSSFHQIQTRIKQGDPVADVTGDPEKLLAMTPKQAMEEGHDFRQYVTALTQHVLRGEKLAPTQKASFPHLARLERFIKEEADAVPTTYVDPTRQATPAKLTRTTQSGEEVLVERAYPRPIIKEAGEIFAPEATPVSGDRKVAGAKRIITHEIGPDGKVRPVEKVVLKDPTPEQKDYVPTPGKPKKAPYGFIHVKDGKGNLHLKPYGHVFVDMPMQPGEKTSRVFSAHPDGQTRRGMIHLDSAEVSLEPAGSTAESFYRSELFSSVDPDKEWGRDIPLFIHQDGTVDLSITPVTTVFRQKQASFGHLAEFGALDRVEQSRAHPGVLGGDIRRSGEEVLGLSGSEPPHFGRFPTTYTARKIRGKVELEKSYRPNVRRAREEGIDVDITDSDDLLEQAEDATVRIRGRKRNTRALPVEPSDLRTGFHEEGFIPQRRTPRDVPDEYTLSKDQLVGTEPHPEWATVRRVARVMQKQGYDPETPLRIRIAREVHQEAAGTPTLTIREAAELELPMPVTDQILEEASARGLKVLPKGTGHEVHFPNGSKRIYEDDLEALEAIQRVPVSQLDVSLDAPLARLWNMGIENGYDAEVDASKFLPVPLQEVVIGQIAKGSRPLAEVRTSNLDEFNTAFAAITADLPKNRRLVVRTLEELGPQEARLAIFDPELVKARQTTFNLALDRLGVNVSNPPEMLIDELDQIPKGLHILSANDPESAIMYSWFRQKSMKGNWQQGKVVIDETGPHREFSPEVKNTFIPRICQ
jgi:endonuclease YncB( thermonuclease family)